MTQTLIPQRGARRAARKTAILRAGLRAGLLAGLALVALPGLALQAKAQITLAPPPGHGAADSPAGAPAPWQPLAADGLQLEDFRWQNRLLVVFADSPDMPAFREQIRELAARPQDLAQRDTLVVADADPGADSALRQRLRPRGFMLVLIDKDGQIAQRKPFPWTLREIVNAIDKMPLRQEELRNQRLGG